MSHVFSFEPPTTDQYEEQARYECMRLVQDGRLDGPRVLSQRDDGVPWSVIRDMATPPRRSGGSTGNLRPRRSSPDQGGPLCDYPCRSTIRRTGRLVTPSEGPN